MDKTTTADGGGHLDHSAFSSTSTEDDTDLAHLASQAHQLSINLNLLQGQCGHETTSTNISDAAEELARLGVELINLNAAIIANRSLYTETFNQDLMEIQINLRGIFDDISDCCKEMQKANGLHFSAVGWLTKKRYVKKLQKHLEANKTTLIVMRTVLHHGKEYGRHNSPGRLAETSPHTMQEDLAILETVFASRNAIKDLHNLEKKSHQHNASTSSTATVDTTPSFKPGAHGRNLSSATGVDIPIMEDVLPISEKKKKQEALARRFSRRGVRLAVHSSIMDTNAHDVPVSLRTKWIHQAHIRQFPGQLSAGGPSTAQLSRISEVNSNFTQDEPTVLSSHTRALTTPEHSSDNGSPEPASSHTPSISDKVTKARGRAASLISSPLGRHLGNLITRLSRTSLQERDVNEASKIQVMEEHLYPSEDKVAEGDSKKKEQSPDGKKDVPAKEKSGWSYRLTRPFVNDELKTPDFERGY